MISTVDKISAAVLQKLLPYIISVEDNLRRDLTSLINEKVTGLRESVSEDLMDYKKPNSIGSVYIPPVQERGPSAGRVRARETTPNTSSRRMKKVTRHFKNEDPFC